MLCPGSKLIQGKISTMNWRELELECDTATLTDASSFSYLQVSWHTPCNASMDLTTQKTVFKCKYFFLIFIRWVVVVE